MRIKSTVFLVSLLFASLPLAQTSSREQSNQDLQKAVLLSDVKTLALEIPKLDGPLARAMATAEIADAAWTLDRKWAKTLLREAYQLTYLTEEEQRLVGPELPGTPPRPPNALTRARTEVRRRILSVARRDNAFADQLLTDRSARLTKDDRQMMYAQMTLMALEEGDNQAAVRSIEENMAIDPSQLMLVQLVNDLARKDRAAADKLIIGFVKNLSNVHLAGGKSGRARAEQVLRWLVFPNSFFPGANERVPNPGAEVMRTYVIYVIETLAALEQREPASLPAYRNLLLTAWLPLNQHAPEFRERFLQLEPLSRTPGKDATLPTKTNEALDQETLRKRETEALNSTAPSEHAIASMIVHDEFESARKLIGKLPDGDPKSHLMEQVNTNEAISRAKKRDLLTAQTLAERLTTIGSILKVYPIIVEGHAANKDAVSATATVHQAIKQLKNVNAKPSSDAKQFGMPGEFAPKSSERDGTLSTLSELAKALLPIDTLLAAEIVDDVVVTANRSSIDTTQGRTGIDSALFRSLAARDAVRARSAAESFKDRLRRTVALAAIYQWKAKELDSNSPPLLKP